MRDSLSSLSIYPEGIRRLLTPAVNMVIETVIHPGSNCAEVLLQPGDAPPHRRVAGGKDFGLASILVSKGSDNEERSAGDLRSLYRTGELEFRSNLEDLRCSALDPLPRSIKLRIAHALMRSDGGSNRRNVPESLELKGDRVAWAVALALLRAGQEEPIGQRTILCLIELLWTRAMKSHTEEAAVYQRTAGALVDWQVERVEQAIATGFRTKLSLQQLARHCQLSVCHFARAFKTTYGFTVHQYVIATRIRHAQELLARSEEAVSQIALDCGFTDQSSFTRRFAAVTGSSPVSWRREWRREHALQGFSSDSSSASLRIASTGLGEWQCG